MKNFTITPKLVHKDSADDVLLGHPRPALPLQIEKSMADVWAEAGLNHLLDLYQADEKNNELLNLSLKGGNHGLTTFIGKNLPVDSSWEPYRALPYQIIESEFSAQQLKNICADIEKTDLSISKLFRSTSYEMVNTADHYFFYRKDHEHVPGIMLIEVQRQAVYAHVYTMTEHVRGDVTISLDKVHCEFYGYADLMYPLELVVDDLQEERSSRAKKIIYRVSFFQRGKLIAIIDSAVNIIDMNQFKRLRNLFMYENDNPAYAPIHAEKINCTLVDTQNKEYAAECLSISREQCAMTHSETSIENIQTIKVSGYGLTFSSTVELESHSKNNAVWRFPSLNPEQLINLGAIIKRGFVQNSTGLSVE